MIENVEEKEGLGASASPTACSPTAEPPRGVSSASPLRPTGVGFTPCAEVYREGRDVVVDGRRIAKAKDEHSAAKVVASIKDGQAADVALSYLTSAIASFDTDPADSDYQRGYLAALRNVRNEAFVGRAA